MMNQWIGINRIPEEQITKVAEIDENGIEDAIQRVKTDGCRYIVDADGEVCAVMISCEKYKMILDMIQKTGCAEQPADLTEGVMIRDEDTISRSTLADMDEVIECYKKGIASEPIEVDEVEI